MTEDELKAIKGRAEKATPQFVVYGQELPDGAIAWNWEPPADGDLYIGYATGPDVTGATFKEIHKKVHAGDGPFFRNARADVLSLITEVERLQAALDLSELRAAGFRIERDEWKLRHDNLLKWLSKIFDRDVPPGVSLVGDRMLTPEEIKYGLTLEEYAEYLQCAAEVADARTNPEYSATETLKRLPVLNDPAITEILTDVIDDEENN